MIKSKDSDTERIDVSQNENIYVFTKIEKKEENLFDFNINNDIIEIRAKKEHIVKEIKEQDEDRKEFVDLW